MSDQLLLICEYGRFGVYQVDSYDNRMQLSEAGSVDEALRFATMRLGQPVALPLLTRGQMMPSVPLTPLKFS